MRKKLIWIIVLAVLGVMMLTACEKKEELPISLDGVTFSDGGGEYAGSAYSLAAQNVPEGVTVSYSDNNSLVNVGEVRVTATFQAPGKKVSLDGEISGSASLTALLKVTPKKVDVRFSVGEKVYYTGKEIEVSAEAEGVLAGEDAEIAVTTSPEIVREVGRYTATATLNNPNYELSGGNQLTFEVVPAMLVSPLVSLVDGVVSWQAVPHASGYRVSYDGETYGDPVSATSVEVDPEHIGTERLVVYVVAVSEEDSYADSLPGSNLTELSSDILSDGGGEFNGSAYALEAELPPGVQAVYSENNSRVEAGSDTVTLTITPDAGRLLRYEGEFVEEAVLTAALTVTPKPVTVRFDLPEELYDTGEEIVLNVEVVGEVEGYLAGLSVTYTPETVLLPGSYAAVAALSSPNYRLTGEAEIDFEVLASVRLEAPELQYDAEYEDGFITWTAVEHAAGYAVSYDGEHYLDPQTALELTAPTGYFTVYVKAVPGGAGYRESEARVLSGYHSGTVAEFTFDSDNGSGVVADASDNGRDIVFLDSYSFSAEDGTVTLGNDGAASSVGVVPAAELPALKSLGVEVVFKLNGYRAADNALVYQYGRFNIVLFGYDTYYDLVTWVGTENNPTNTGWDFAYKIDKKHLLDGNFHHIALTYDAETGMERVYFDYTQLTAFQKQNMASPLNREGSYDLCLGAGDVVNRPFAAPVTYDYLRVSGFAPDFADFEDYTDRMPEVLYERTGADVPDYTGRAIEVGGDQYSPYAASMSFGIAFSLKDLDMPAGRTTFGFRDWAFHLFVIKDNGNYFIQAFLATYANQQWGSPDENGAMQFLDFGMQNEIADGNMHTVEVAYDCLTGYYYGYVDGARVSFATKYIGGPLMPNGLFWPEHAPQSLFVGGMSNGEYLPASTTIYGYYFSGDPNKAGTFAPPLN